VASFTDLADAPPVPNILSTHLLDAGQQFLRREMIKLPRGEIELARERFRAPDQLGLGLIVTSFEVGLELLVHVCPPVGFTGRINSMYRNRRLYGFGAFGLRTRT
jgi:hypothetical protein